MPRQASLKGSLHPDRLDQARVIVLDVPTRGLTRQQVIPSAVLRAVSLDDLIGEIEHGWRHS
jgi:hypothetical protein